MAEHGAGGAGIALASIALLVWRHPLAAIAARAVAVPGAVFAAVCLASGSIWGRPTWGTWWEWDGRLTSMLLLFFVYLAYIALAKADADRGGDGRVPAIFRDCRHRAAADHPLFGGVVEHVASRAEHRADQLDDRPVDPLAAMVHAVGVHLAVRGHRPDADARDAGDREGRGADAQDG